MQREGFKVWSSNVPLLIQAPVCIPLMANVDHGNQFFYLVLMVFQSIDLFGDRHIAWAASRTDGLAEISISTRLHGVLRNGLPVKNFFSLLSSGCAQWAILIGILHCSVVHCSIQWIQSTCRICSAIATCPLGNARRQVLLFITLWNSFWFEINRKPDW